MKYGTEELFKDFSTLNIIKELNFKLSEEDFFSEVYKKIYSIIEPDFALLYLLEKGRLKLKGDPHKESSIPHNTKKYYL